MTTIAPRTLLVDFSLGNPLYAHARVWVYEADVLSGRATGTLAPLYRTPSGTQLESNPLHLDGDGKLVQAVYLDRPVVCRVTDAAVPGHDTGVIGMVSRFRGDWEAGALYQIGDIVRDGEPGDATNYLYMAADIHRSGASWTNDLALGKWQLYLQPPDDNMRIADLATAGPLAGANFLAVNQGGVTKKITVTAFQAQAPAGPRGPQGFPGPRGFKGDKGDKGDAGSVIQLGTIGGSEDILDRPASASEGDIWLHLTVPTATAYMWDGGAWVNVGPIGATQSTPVAGIVYCTMSGDDTNPGTSLAQAVQTIERAVQVLQGLNGPAVIQVYPGDYEWTNSMTLPPGSGAVSLGGQFVTNLVCVGAPETNCFLVNSGSYIQGFTFRGQAVDDFDNPTAGFAVAFAPGATIMRSPYIRDISQVSNYAANLIAAPLDPANANPLVGKGGGVLLADRAVLNPNSKFPYMLAFGATPRSPNGLGYVAKNGAGINGISSIAIFQRASFYALNGGQITLNNSGTQFGDISMRAKGSTQVVVPFASAGPLAANGTLAQLIEDNAVSIEAAVWSAISATYPTVNQTFTRRDTLTLLRALALDMRSGDDQSCQVFALGLFNWQGNLVFNPAQTITGGTLLSAFNFGFDQVEARVRLVGSLSASTSDMLWGLVDLIKRTVATPTRRTNGSLIESLGHQFNQAGAGVNGNALPLLFRRIGQPLRAKDSILEEDGGTVLWTGADETGASYFPGELEISDGRLRGKAFSRTINTIARRAANRGAF